MSGVGYVVLKLEAGDLRKSLLHDADLVEQRLVARVDRLLARGGQGEEEDREQSFHARIELSW